MTRYSNPWASFKLPKWHTIFTSISRHASEDASYQAKDIKVVPIEVNLTSPRPQVIWLGHASVYLLLPGDTPMGILFDPIFSNRCSPVQWMGPKRRMPTPCLISQLPTVNYVVISHDHYDHLDKHTIREIERFHPGVQYLVPSGLAKWFVKLGIPRSRVCELQWWEERSFAYESTLGEPVNAQAQGRMSDSAQEKSNTSETSKTQLQSSPIPEFKPGSHSPSDTQSITLFERPTLGIRFICTPAQHNSGRTIFSQNKTLWASWVVEVHLPHTGEVLRVFFGGDTGYRSDPSGPVCPIFRDIAERYGPPDVSFLPLAAGSVLPFLEDLFRIKLDHARLTSAIHCTPRDAVEIHQSMKSRLSIGIHWGTFTTKRHALETMMELKRECAVRRVSVEGEGEFRVVDAGRVIQL